MQRKIYVTSIDELLDERPDFNCIIDVRSPAEFLEDHISGAINCPVLNNEERNQVGTIYKQVNPFTARKHGASIVSRNISQHIEQFSCHEKDWRPLLYCWRGGQRSRSLGLVMQEIGWPVALLDGGYKAYRRKVQTSLETLLERLNLIVLSGPTGCGKTEILARLEEQGQQVVDLEGLAQHRGSILGQDPNQPQPSQKFFESLLYDTLSRLDLKRPIWMESESSKIGDIHLPKSLCQGLMRSTAIALRCERSKRAQYLLNYYSHLTKNQLQTQNLIKRLEFRHGKKQIGTWLELIKNDHWIDLSASLLELHYDPAYERSQQRFNVKYHYSLAEPGRLPSNLTAQDFFKG